MEPPGDMCRERKAENRTLEKTNSKKVSKGIESSKGNEVREIKCVGEKQTNKPKLFPENLRIGLKKLGSEQQS